MALIPEKASARVIGFFDRQFERALTTPKLRWFDRAFEKLAGKAPELGRERLVASTGSSGIIINPNLLMSITGTGGGPVIAPEFPDGIARGKRGNYTIMKKFGSEGAMSKIYIVRDAAGNSHLMKVVLDFAALGLNQSQQNEMHARFKRETDILEKMNDPHFPRLIDRDPADQTKFFIMELINGLSLFNMIEMIGERNKQIDPITAARIISEVLKALIVFGQAVAPTASDQYAHRDIKPENIMLELKNNKIGRVVLIDFGIAKLPQSTLTGFQVYFGTPLYSAPEIFTCGASVADQHSDNYALGAVLYWLLTGELPFDLSNQHKIMDFVVNTKQHYNKLIQNPSNFVPIELMSILMRAMSPVPKDRYQTYIEFKTVLDGALRSLTPKRK
jgi:serine/threonine-protein kinase